MSVSPRISVQSVSESSASASIVLYKRTINKLSVKSAENKPISIENLSNSNFLRSKRVRKVVQNVQFVIYQDETSFLDSYSSNGYKGFSPVDSDPQTDSTRPKIVVEIPFRLEIHQKRGPLYLSEILHSNLASRGSK